MLGSFLTRGLLLALGYAYPGYECYKAVELNKPDIEALRFWCQYWVLVAMLTVCERIGDMFMGWLPMYGEAKLAFFVYLWFPKTKGTTFVYNSFFRPYLSKHETEIDRNILELKTRAGDMVLMYGQKAITFAQTRVLDILQYIATQSAKKPAQPQAQAQTPAGTPRPPEAKPEQKPKADPAPAAKAGASDKAKADPAALNKTKAH